MCSNALSSLPPLLEFRTTHAVGDVDIPAQAFPFPLMSPSEMLIEKELRSMPNHGLGHLRIGLLGWTDYPLISRNTRNP